MTQNQHLTAVPAARRNSPSVAYSTAESVIPHLAACLALVRPVNMSEEAAAEWLAVAARELAGYHEGLVVSALANARKECTFHSQIVPFAIKNMEERTPFRMGKPLDRVLPATQREQLPPREIQGLITNASEALTRR